eukprot:sb/3465413/
MGDARSDPQNPVIGSAGEETCSPTWVVRVGERRGEVSSVLLVFGLERCVVNAADAFDIGNFNEDDTKGIKLTKEDEDHYREFDIFLSYRWQKEIVETIFDTVNTEADKIENKKPKRSASVDLSGDCILQGYLLKLGGPFLSQWQKKYFHLFPNRLEWRAEPSTGGVDDVMMTSSKCHVTGSPPTASDIIAYWRDTISSATGLWQEKSLANNLITMDDLISVRDCTYKTYEKCICLELSRNKKSSDIYLRTENDIEFEQWFKHLSSTLDTAIKMLKRGGKMLRSANSSDERGSASLRHGIGMVAGLGPIQEGRVICEVIPYALYYFRAISWYHCYLAAPQRGSGPGYGKNSRARKIKHHQELMPGIFQYSQDFNLSSDTLRFILNHLGEGRNLREVKC